MTYTKEMLEAIARLPIRFVADGTAITRIGEEGKLIAIHPMHAPIQYHEGLWHPLVLSQTPRPRNAP